MMRRISIPLSLRKSESAGSFSCKIKIFLLVDRYYIKIFGWPAVGGDGDEPEERRDDDVVHRVRHHRADLVHEYRLHVRDHPAPEFVRQPPARLDVGKEPSRLAHDEEGTTVNAIVTST